MRFIRVLIIAVLIILPASGVFAETKEPEKIPEKIPKKFQEKIQEKIINEFHVVLLQVMKEAKFLSAKERYTKLAPAIDQAFDLGFMIRVASGTAWRKANDEDKAALTKAFRRMSIATYAFRFKGFSGQRFETLKTGDGPRKMQLVYTQIVSPVKNKRDDIVKLTYVMKKFQAGWRVVDVLLDGGISELSVKHSEYRTTLKTKGAGVLAQILVKKADQLIAD